MGWGMAGRRELQAVLSGMGQCQAEQLSKRAWILSPLPPFSHTLVPVLGLCLMAQRAALSHYVQFLIGCIEELTEFFIIYFNSWTRYNNFFNTIGFVDAKGSTLLLICKSWSVWSSYSYYINTLPKLIEICSQNSNFESVEILELNSDPFLSYLSFSPPSINSLSRRGENETWWLFSL